MTSRQKLVVSIGIVITIAMAIGLFMFFSGMKKKMKPLPPAKTVRKVESAIVKYANIETHITGNGRVLSQQSINLISEVQGKVLEGDIPLKKGSSFRKGQLLAHIYNTDAVYSIKSSKSTFLNSLAAILPDLKIDYPDSYPKWYDFFESVDIERDLPKLPETSSSQEKVFLSGKNILSTYYTIKASEEKLKKYYLWAPFTGSIQEVSLEVGSVANIGSSIASLIKTGRLEVEVPLKTEDAKWVSMGQLATIYSEKGQQIGKGKVVRRATYVDAASQSMNIYIELLPSSEDVYTGEYLQAKFDGMLVTAAMEIPRNAIFNANEVFIVDSGYLSKREINILKINEQTLLFNGLEEGSEVVIQPLANAASNIPVQTQFSNVHNETSSDSTATAHKPEV